MRRSSYSGSVYNHPVPQNFVIPRSSHPAANSRKAQEHQKNDAPPVPPRIREEEPPEWMENLDSWRIKRRQSFGAEIAHFEESSGDSTDHAAAATGTNGNCPETYKDLLENTHRAVSNLTISTKALERPGLSQRPQNLIRGMGENAEHAKGELYSQVNKPIKQDAKKVVDQVQREHNHVRICRTCKEPIEGQPAMKIEQLMLYFHLKCFRCRRCGVPLTSNGTDSGVEVCIQYSKLFCLPCFHRVH